MWSNRTDEEADADPRAVWELIVAVHSGERTVEGHESYATEGPLANGAVVRPVVDSFVGPELQVVEYEAGRRYAHEFAIRRYVVRMGYTIEPRAEGGTRLIRTIDITGPYADLAMVGLGQLLITVYAPQARALLEASGSAPE